MPRPDPLLLDEAAAWLVRTRDPAFRDWAGFTAWLERDAAYNQAYELALDTHEAVAELVPPAIATADIPTPRRLPLRWIGGLAAGLLAATGAATLVPRHDTYRVETAAGEQRAVRLVDGTTIAMNGATRVTLDRDRPRFVRLDGGEATFTVVHDAARPFRVETGDAAIEDVGTVFNVVRSRDATEVAVAEGAVVYDPAGASVKLTAGRTLHDPDRGNTEIGDANPAAVGAWRHGRLSYRAAPLARVATDIARLIGEPVDVAPQLAARDFSGTIMVRGVAPRILFARLAAIMNVAVGHDRRGWHLTTGGDGPV